MSTQKFSQGNTLLISLLIAFGTIATATLFVVMKPILLPNQASTVQAEISSALTKYCEDPSLLEKALEKASIARLTELVTQTKKTRDQISCASAIVKKAATGKITPTEKPTSDANSYNNHYWCESDNVNKCEICWIDDYDHETCCYKSSKDIAAGNDKCGPNDETFPASKKTIVGKNRFTSDTDTSE